MDGGNFAGTLDSHVLGNLIDIVEQDDTHITLLKVEGYTFHSVFEFDKLVGADVVKAIYMSYAVADFKYDSRLLEGNFGVDILQLLF